MCDQCNLPRRRFLLSGALAVGAAGLNGLTRTAQAAEPATAPASAQGAGEFVIRGGTILSMDPAIGDIAKGDIHVRDGAIVAVGENLQVEGAETIDAADMIVLPGFVDTHWHLWSTSLRSIVRADDPKAGYFPTTMRIGVLFEPEDSYAGVRLGVAEALMSGITTVHNWSHNTRTPAHADAEIKALRDCGVRARFSYGWGPDLPLTSTMNLGDLPRVREQWTDGQMLGIGAALRTPRPNARGELPIEVLKAEVDGIRKLGMPMTMHAGSSGLVPLLAGIDALGPDMLLVHPQSLSPEDLKTVKETGTRYSSAPAIEISFSAVRSGRTQYEELRELGIPLGLSVDSSGASANSDYFSIMRALMWTDWQRSGAPLQLLPRRLIELATIEGARLLDLDAEIGSLTPGKRADVILVRKNDVNMAPVGDPYYSLVFSAQPANVDTVFVDGRRIVSGGKAVEMDLSAIVAEATTSIDGVMARAG